MNYELTSLLALLASSKRGDRGEVEWGGGGEDTDFAAAALASNSRNKLRDFFEMPVSIWERKNSIIKTCQLEHKFTGLNQNKLNKMSEKAQWSWNERTSEFQSFLNKKNTSNAYWNYKTMTIFWIFIFTSLFWAVHCFFNESIFNFFNN